MDTASVRPSDQQFFVKFFQDVFAAQKLNEYPLIIFDIDSTLVHVHTRNQAILRDFFKLHPNARDFTAQLEKLKDFEFKPTEFGLEETLARAGVKLEEPFWSCLQSFWHERFFSSDYLHCDEPVAGALEFLQILDSENIPFCYLTGRDHPNMLQGTLSSFQELGFPVNSDTPLLLKPHSGVSDEEFKRTALKRLVERHGPIWFFENEPLNLVMCAESYPAIQMIMPLTTHSKRAMPPKHVISIQDFRLAANAYATVKQQQA